VINPLAKSEAGAMAHPNSFVGIFWAIPGEGSAIALVDHRCSLTDAELYGSMLTCAHGHHEVWDQWRERMVAGKGPVASVVATSEYEEWPRGRIVYDSEAERFVVYADAQILRRVALLSAIRERFVLPIGRTVAKRDSHYRGARRLERYILNHDFGATETTSSTHRGGEKE
jgi:hypothetical protein